jgi:hypothetical protein
MTYLLANEYTDARRRRRRRWRRRRRRTRRRRWWRLNVGQAFVLKLSVGLTGQVYLHEIEGLFSEGSVSGDLVSGNFALNGSAWSTALRYHNFHTRPDIDFNNPHAWIFRSASAILAEESTGRAAPKGLGLPEPPAAVAEES